MLQRNKYLSAQNVTELSPLLTSPLRGFMVTAAHR
jgi:hypothetical protein